MKFFCFSMDFELRWGVRHLFKGNFSKYTKELDGAAAAAIALCDFFDRKQIPTTWATVGALAMDNWEEFFSVCSLQELNRRSNYSAEPEEFKKKNEKYYFAPETLKHLVSSDYTEVATHTFTHIFCCEPHVTETMFRADVINACDALALKSGQRPESIVFPRNQVNFLDALPSLGIDAYRANEIGDGPQANTLLGNNLLRKAKRFSSSINPFLANSAEIHARYTRASLFLRLDLPVGLWQLHLARIRNELERLRDGQCLHLWCHPHNLGRETEMKLKRVEEVMSYVLPRRDEGDLKIRSMKDIRPEEAAKAAVPA